jgi:hypothetical protein
MGEPSQRARAYLQAFAEEHQAPAVVPPWRSRTTVTLAASLRVLGPLLGIAAVAVAAWGASRATAIEVAHTRHFEAAPHRVERSASEAIEPAPRFRAPIARPRIVQRPPEAIVAAPIEPERAHPRGPSSLRRELALLDAAKSALRRGDRAAARLALERHAKLFPDGLLAPERRRLVERTDEDTESIECVHSSCVRSDEQQEPKR